MAVMTNEPGAMEQRGDKLLREAAQYDMKAVQTRLDRFRKAHEKWKAAQEKKTGAVGAQRQVQEAAGALDAAQDSAVDALAAALPADGFPRINPFAPFKAPSPTNLKRLGEAVEARACLALAKKVLAHQATKAGSRAAAKTLQRAAQAVLVATDKVPDAQARASALRKNRDALVPEWSKAWHLLQRACQMVEEDGGEALYSKLFAPKAAARVKVARAASTGATASPAP